MPGSKSVEIECTACGVEALLVREPVYEGFSKVGEELRCSACGHIYESEQDVRFKHRKKVQVFTDTDRSHDPEVFEAGEADRLCRYCVNYVVNPFRQWCGFHGKEVEATDTCAQFERTEEPPQDDDEPEESPPFPF